MECGKAAGASIVGHRTAWDTTTGRPDQLGMVGERMAGGKQVGSHGLGRTGWKDSRSGYAVETSMTWNDSLERSGNGVGQM